MTQNTIPLPKPGVDLGYVVGGLHYTADQMHAHAAKVCAEKDAEIERLRADAARVSALLAAINMQLGNGFIPWEIEDAYAEYESTLKETK